MPKAPALISNPRREFAQDGAKILNFDLASWTSEDEFYAKFMKPLLDEHYPGHSWLICPSSTQRIVAIRDMNLSTSWGVYIHMDKCNTHDELRRQTIMLAGELLERFNVRRGQFHLDDYAPIWKNHRKALAEAGVD
jgi:hypothetical protein